jgi:hypothetical protein
MPRRISPSEAQRLSQMYTSGVLAKADFERAQANAAERRAAADGLRLSVNKLEQQRLPDVEDRQAHLEGLKSEINRGVEATTQASIKRLEDEVDRRTKPDSDLQCISAKAFSRLSV